MRKELVVTSRFSGTFGLAGAAKLAVRALKSLGITVHAVDTQKHFMLPGGVAAHLQYDNPESDGRVVRLPDPSIPCYGMWHWELPVAPGAWVQRKVVDEIWTPSPFVAKAFSNPHTPTRVVVHPLVAADYEVQPLPRPGPFHVVSMFDWRSSRVRKNPEATIAAFKQAFGKDPAVQLTIKSQCGYGYKSDMAILRESIKDYPNIQLIDSVWDYPRVLAFIRSADTLISPHRAEGFGLSMAEAMLMGVPVVATGYSGNLAFMDESNSILLPYTLIPVQDVSLDPVALPYSEHGDQVWADPSVEAAAEALQRLHRDLEYRKHLAQEGQRSVLHSLSPEQWFKSLPSACREVL